MTAIYLAKQTDLKQVLSWSAGKGLMYSVDN